MVKRNSFTKFMLIVCGIVLMTAVFSGCTDADAPGPQTQLSDAPSGDDNSAIRTLGGESLDDLFDMAKNNPNKLLGMDIYDIRLPKLGEANGGSGVIENSEYDLAWKNKIPGIEKYVEEYNYNGELEVVRIRIDENHRLNFYDKYTTTENKNPDTKIEKIIHVLDGKQTIIKAE